MVVRDHEVAPLEGGGGSSSSGHGLAGAGRLAGGVERVAGSQQRLRGDAGQVVALAAHPIAFDDRDPESAIGEDAGAVLPGRAGADHDRVVLAHRP